MIIKIWCDSCHGTGYEEIPNYDWDESFIGFIEYKCDDCNGNGYIKKRVSNIEKIEETL